MLVERLGGRWSASGGLCRCPAHDDRSPSLSVRAGRTRLLLHCFAGCSVSQVLDALSRDGLLIAGPGGPEREIAPHRGRSRSAVEAIWSGGRSVEGTPAAAYLASRGLHRTWPELRFNPRTPSGRAPLTRFRPALIAAVRDDSGLVGIQRTFLDCSEDTAAERAGLGRFGSGAVRFGGHARAMGLAEGIETALSAAALFDMPCWATLGSERFGLISLPPGVEDLHLFLDHDAGGRRAQGLARERFEGLPIHTHVPPGRGHDWNDVVRRIRADEAERGEEARGR